MVRKVLMWTLIGVLIIGLALGGLHLYLLVSGRGLQLHIGTFNIIRLGSPAAFLSADLEQSFVQFDQSSSSTSIRKPRYERNTLYARETQGDITAKDIDTGQEEIFSWGDQTHYLCLSPIQYQVEIQGKPVDPAKTLKNYVFLNTGNNVGGTSAPDIGYYMFKRDVDIGTPVKFILTNETKNDVGGYNILIAIVFTPHAQCAKPTDAASDLPSL